MREQIGQLQGTDADKQEIERYVEQIVQHRNAGDASELAMYDTCYVLESSPAWMRLQVKPVFADWLESSCGIAKMRYMRYKTARELLGSATLAGIGLTAAREIDRVTTGMQDRVKVAEKVCGFARPLVAEYVQGFGFAPRGGPAIRIVRKAFAKADVKIAKAQRPTPQRELLISGLQNILKYSKCQIAQSIAMQTLEQAGVQVPKRAVA